MLRIRWTVGPPGPLGRHPCLRWQDHEWSAWLSDNLEATLRDWAVSPSPEALCALHRGALREMREAATQLAAEATDPAGVTGVLQLATNAWITLDVIAAALCGAVRPPDSAYVLARSLAGLVDLAREDAYHAPLAGGRVRPEYAAFVRHPGMVQPHHVANIFRVRKSTVHLRLDRSLARIRSEIGGDMWG